MRRLQVGIAVISSLFYPYYGGAEKQLELLARECLSRGVDCLVITRRLGCLKSTECLNSLPIYRIFASSANSVWLSTLTFIISGCFFFITHPSVTRKVHILQADCDSPGVIALIIGILFRKRVVIRMRGTGQQEFISKSRVLTAYLRTILKLSDSTVIQYDQERALVGMGINARKIRLIPNGVNVNFFKKSNTALSKGIREKMGLNSFVIGLYVGRIDHIKGLDILLAALPNVLEKYPEFRLIVVGSGPFKDHVCRQSESLGINGKVIFKGDVEDVKKYYEIADIFILPSRGEGISNALLEAMSMELPVIATDVGGSKKVVTNLTNGFLVEVSASEISKKIKLLIGDVVLRRNFGKAARRTIETCFSSAEIAEKYCELYLQVLSR